MSRPAIIATVVAVIAAEAILIATDTGPNIWLVAAIVTLVSVAIWFPTSLGRVVARPAPAPDRTNDSWSFPDLRTTTLRQALAAGDKGSRHAARIHKQLVTIVDDELRANGIDRSAEPDTAAQVLGPELDRFVSDPDSVESLTPEYLTRIVTLIERI